MSMVGVEVLVLLLREELGKRLEVFLVKVTSFTSGAKHAHEFPIAGWEVWNKEFIDTLG